MLASVAAFVLNDSLLKLASANIPTFQLLFLRAIVACIIGAFLIAVLGQWRALPTVLEKRTLLRGAAETAATFCFMTALIQMPIADVFAIAQTVPLFLIFGAALVYGDRITPLQIALAAVGLGGSFLVAQPTFDGLPAGAIFAFGCAMFIASRDLVGRGISANTPVLVVTVSTSAMVLIASGLLHATFETWVAPSPHEASFILAAGTLVGIGQVGVVLAYRLASTATIAPLFYSFAIWSVLAGFFIFSEIPNRLAVTGILLIVASGLALVHISQKQTPRAT
jgi:drug/metabolite transporter (DMT)-like permease